MPLINTIPTFRAYYKVAFSTDAAGLPDMAEIERKYILPVLGETLYESLVAQVEANTITMPGLLDCVRRLEAPLAVADELINRHVQVTDAGLKKLSSSNTESVFRWEYNELKDNLQQRIALAYDTLWQELYTNGELYSWTDPTPYTVCIKTAGEFTQLYPLQQPYRMYALLKPIMAEVEDFYIGGAIGDDFWSELKATLLPGPDEATAILLAKKAVAYLTIYKSIEKLSVMITPKGITVLFNRTADQPTDGQKFAEDNQVSLLYNSTFKDGSSYIKKLKNLLNAKASVDLFATYFNSTLYQAPTTTPAVSRNATRTGLVGL